MMIIEYPCQFSCIYIYVNNWDVMILTFSTGISTGWRQLRFIVDKSTMSMLETIENYLHLK